jgi:hypothetical protein
MPPRTIPSLELDYPQPTHLRDDVWVFSRHEDTPLQCEWVRVYQCLSSIQVCLEINELHFQVLVAVTHVHGDRTAGQRELQQRRGNHCATAIAGRRISAVCKRRLRSSSDDQPG